MTLQEYEDIMKEASKRFEIYNSMVGNMPSRISRKEDLAEYWIAVVAFERGQHDTL